MFFTIKFTIFTLFILLNLYSCEDELVTSVPLIDKPPERICAGSIQSEFRLNTYEAKELSLNWTYDIDNATLSVDFRYNRTLNSNEYVILTLIPSNAQMIGFRLDRSDKQLNENTFWNHLDNTTRYEFSNEHNLLQLSQNIVLSNLECKSFGVYIYDYNKTTVNHLYSTQIGLCTNLFPSTNCFKRRIPGIGRLIKQIQLHKGPFQNIYNDFFPLKFRKRDIQDVLNKTQRLVTSLNHVRNDFQDYLVSSVNPYISRIDKVMLMRGHKIVQSLQPLALGLNSTLHETSFIIRVIKASDMVLDCLEATIANFVKHILIKSDDGLKNTKVDLKYDETKLEEYKESNRTNSFIDIQITLKSQLEFSPISFLDTLQFIAVKPNKTRNVFVYGDLWLDLDPDLQFVYDYDDDIFADNKDLYKYQPLWVIGLIVIAGVLTVVFIGCIVAICYKRRPYRRASKIYEMEAAIREKQIPKIPTMSLQVKSTELAAFRSNPNHNLPLYK